MKSFLSAVIVFVFITGFVKPHLGAKNFTIQQLAPGVWAAIQNDKGGHAISNAGIVDLGDKTLVFDAFINPDAARELKQIAERLTKHHVSLLIDSHFHDDHIRGNQAFIPEASIISTEWTKNEMQRVEPEEQAWAKKNIGKQVQKAKHEFEQANKKEKDEALMWLGYYEAISQSLPELKTTLPDITFNDSMWIYGSARNVVLVECRNCHTGSDVVMVLPKEGIVFMGDVLFVGRHPWFGDGDPDSLRKNLEHFYSDQALKQFVPGHGPAAGKESLQLIIQYIADVKQLATQAIQRGEADSIFIKRPVLPQYKDWWYGRFYSDNLEFVYGKMKK